ncbi:DUF4259 domain-containing protein [Actinospica durhamensis]|uniref:DUF4259 domain-containing protein n=1 Tax=Actinospica durhamensis TaxID=1508375 RepID=A0A941EKR4_9ACTN|nr:DUF4259 domain-containing protein [Actinospica durhamensis]MBR7832158.1 DUF4259 domain-containing protein [Actinospica durhamensis]
MGTWQVGPFDNDVAMDFFDEIEETPDPEVPAKLSSVLSAVAGRPGRVELAEGHLAVAAAGLVAAGRSRSAATGNPSVDEWLTVHRPVTDTACARLALAALDRVGGSDSEWMDLWATTDNKQAVRDRLEELRAVLSG